MAPNLQNKDKQSEPSEGGWLVLDTSNMQTNEYKGGIMKKRFLAALATGLLVVGMGGVAQALTFTQGDELLPELADSTEANYTGTSQILAWLDAFGPDDFVSTAELYKDDEDTGESGSFGPYYTTTYTEGEEDATITWDGDVFINNPTYVLVKDGQSDNLTPSWYLFDIKNWDGQEDLSFSGLWPNQGSISHISIYGGGSPPPPVPEPATMLLFGTGLAGLAGIARRRKKN